MNLLGRRDYIESALVATVLLVAFGGVWAELHYAPAPAPSPVGGYALTLAAAAALLPRRTRPMLSAALVLAL